MDLEQAIAALKARQVEISVTGLKNARRGDTFEYGVLAGRVVEIDQAITILINLENSDNLELPRVSVKKPNPYFGDEQ